LPDPQPAAWGCGSAQVTIKLHLSLQLLTPYQAIIFDFDGVLVDSEPIHYECWVEILARHGVTLDWETYTTHCIGISDRAMLEMLCRKASGPLDFDKLWQDYPRKKELFRSRMMHADAIDAEVRGLIDSLRPDYKLAVVTSSGKREVEPILTNAGLLNQLDTVIYGDDVKNLKPAPDPYLLAVERLGVSRALAIEDSQAGITSARAAGLDVIELTKQADLVSAVETRLTTPPTRSRQP
jgi:beta-phosphoglucomutase